MYWNHWNGKKTNYSFDDNKKLSMKSNVNHGIRIDTNTHSVELRQKITISLNQTYHTPSKTKYVTSRVGEHVLMAVEKGSITPNRMTP